MTIIGIDLGTTNSLIAVYKEGTAKILANALGENLTPSVVSLDPNGEILVGKAAAERLVTHPEYTVANFKRYMGTDKIFKLKQHKFRAEDLASFVLRNLKADAEFLLQEEITEAVISVPAYFNDTQRKATILAGQLAGLKVERLINEPTAAALAYGLHDKDDEKTFLVFDLGGGTFDVSILEMYEGIMEVRASGGDNYLGGEDFLEVLVKDFLDKTNLDKKNLTSNELSRLYFLGERCKKNLSIQEVAKLEIEIQGKAFQWEIDRARFEQISETLIQRMSMPVERALRDASIKPTALDSVVLVGGATKMPLMRSLVSKMFGRLPASHINPEEVVAIGTAIQAGLKARDKALHEVVLTDVCPYSLGVSSASQVGEGYVSGMFLPILERNTVVPASKIKQVSTISPRQTAVLIEVYQGESRVVKNNIKLGQFSVDLMPMEEFQEIDIRFTYDINGILEVESTVLTTGAKRIEVFENHAIAITKEDIAQRFKELSEIKIHPRDQAENQMVMAKAERMYEKLLGPGRDYLQLELGRFEQIIENQNVREIEKARINLHELLERIEENY